MVQLKTVKAWLKKRHTNGVEAWLRCEKWCPWAIRWTSSSSSSIYDDDAYIPRDVPKGHLVVYVGENESRFVISVKLLKDPLFNALLDKAREEYDFTAGSRLHIPCNENAFLSVVHCDRRSSFCI
ncbi:putative small auxin-up RNA [Helianthus debilis subsp. tardiflorus]